LAPDSKIELRRLLREAEGDPAAVLTECDALEAGGGLESAAEFGALAYARAKAFWRKGDFTRALSATEASIQQLRAAGRQCILNEAELMRGTILINLSRYNEALPVLMDAAAYFEEAGFHEGIGRAYGSLGLLYAGTGDGDAALASYHQAIEAFEKAGNPGLAARVRSNTADYYLHHGDAREALHVSMEAYHYFRDHGSPYEIAMVANNLGTSLVRLGRHEEAIAFFEEALHHRLKMGNPEDISLSTFQIINALVQRGDHQKAKSALRHFDDLLDRGADDKVDFFHKASLAAIAADPENPDHDLTKAAAFYEEALALAEDHIATFPIIDLMKMLVDVYERNGEAGHALRALKALREKEKGMFKESAKDQTLRLSQLIDLHAVRIQAQEEEKKRKEIEQLHDSLAQKSEALQRSNDRLLKLYELQKEFVGIAAHDIRSPLANIVSLSQLIEADPKNVEEVRDLNGRIGETANSLIALVEELLTIQEIENHSFTATEEPCDLLQMAGRAWQSVEDLARRKRIQPVYAPRETINAMADQKLLQRVLFNLIHNAIKYSPPESTVSIEASRKENGVFLSIRDSGPGIRRDEMPKLFQKFVKLHKEAYGEASSGLGLYIASKLMEKMKGRIWCESDGQNGATFYLLLPVASDAPAPGSLNCSGSAGG
jgi:signal transduction histidine kinase